jgi:hypothetical protein
MSYSARPRRFALLLAGAGLACTPGASTSATEGGESMTDTESTSTSAASAPMSESDGETETSSTTDATGVCTTGGGEDATGHACGCTINTCANGNWEACDDLEGPSWCSIGAMLTSVTYCASDSLDCGPVLESCGEQGLCDDDPDAREYDEEALDCTLAALRDRAPGTYGWSSTLDGSYSGAAGVFHLRAGGAMWARECEWEDLGTSMDPPSGLELASPDYFAGCLVMPAASARWACMRGGLTRTTAIAFCDGGTGGPPPLGTCADGGVAWAGSAIFQGSDSGALQQLAGVECIEGPLRIDGVLCEDVLDALASVRRIDGSLTLRGLAVTDLGPLSALEEVGGAVIIEGLPEATSLAGLSGVAVVPGQLYLRDLPKLADLSGLEGLTSVDAILMRELGVASLAGLGPVGPSTLEIWECPALTSLAGLEGMSSALNVRLIDVPSLKSLDGLNNLVSAEFLQISDAGVVDLVGLDALAQVAALSVRGQVLVDVGPLPSLVSVDSLDVSYSPLVASLSGLAGVAALPGGLRLADLPALDDLSGLSSVAAAGDVDVRLCDALVDLSGLGALATAASITLEDNASLASVVGLDALTAVAGSFIIRENPALVDMAGMVLAPAIGGRLQFWKNPSLKSLAGMEGVTAIVGDLSIVGNLLLTSLDALANLTLVDGNLEISDNVQLPTQDALDFAAKIEITGSTEIGGNG